MNIHLLHFFKQFSCNQTAGYRIIGSPVVIKFRQIQCAGHYIEFEFTQMAEIVLGIQKGFTEEQLLLYADHRIHPNTMRMIVNDIADGVPPEIVRKYVKFKKNGQFDSKAFDRRMYIIRKELLKRLSGK
jgi:hypothetical protein